MELLFCQSCSMPMDSEETLGTNPDGSKNRDYCTYCYQNGAFTLDTTLEGMVEVCVPHMGHLAPDQARRQLQEVLPKLKRWQQA